MTFGVVGAGWRAEFFVRLARLMPDQLTLVGVVGSPFGSCRTAHPAVGHPAFLSPAELVHSRRPDFVISCVPRSANPDVVAALVESGVHVLSETPPAPDLDGLRKLWAQVGSRDLVQVAEQYLLMPGHAARRELVNRGVIGQPTSVQVSSTHNYHAVSMIRGLLGIGFEPAKVFASRFTGPLVDPLSRSGWTGDGTPKRAATTIATMDFGEASGLYDFTDNQWHNRLRLRRIVIRGSHGEIADDTVVRLAGERTIVKSSIIRSQLGYDLNLDGYDTEHISFDGDVVYRNAYLGLRLMDEEIALASLLTATGAWARGDGPAPYPLAQGCQDHLIGLAIDESATTGARIVTAVEPWGR